MTAVVLEVFGIPQPKGSMSAVRTKTGRTVMLQGKSTAQRAASTSWRQAVETAARDWQAANSQPLIDEPAAVSMLFRLPRPKSAPKRRIHPDRMPDLDKLCRHAIDALVGIILHDDARICELRAKKFYVVNTPPGATIYVSVLE